MVAASDLKVYRSTGQLGGAITGTQIISGTPNNLFGNVPINELVTGKDYYKCVYLKNTHATENMDNFKLWLSDKSFPHDTEIKWGYDPSAVAQTIPNVYTSPTGITWKSLQAEPSQPDMQNLTPAETSAIWIWYHVNANAVSRLDDSELFSFKFDIPQGGTGTPGGGDTGGTGGNPPPANADYKIAVSGDWGCESMTDDVISLIRNGGYNHVIGIGDNAYASSSCWISKFTPLKSIMESAFGNHEYSESGGVSPYKTFFAYNSTYLTYKFQNIFVMIIDSNINMDPGSAQHNAIKAALEASQTDNTITWRIGVDHHPWFGASSSHSYNNGNVIQAFHQLFINNKVSFVLTGHNHNWQRSKQVSYNSGSPTSPTVVASTSPYSRTAAGLIHIVSGGGGHDSGSSLYSLGSQPGFQAYQNRTHNGIWEIVASNNAQTLTCSFVDVDGTKFDTIVINA
jgi:Calcineurin-like phosphoesterase/Iron/zinc purple acid phosphatase-like protein C